MLLSSTHPLKFDLTLFIIFLADLERIGPMDALGGAHPSRVLHPYWPQTQHAVQSRCEVCGKVNTRINKPNKVNEAQCNGCLRIEEIVWVRMSHFTLMV